MLKSYRVGWSQSLCGGVRVHVVEPESMWGARVGSQSLCGGARVYVAAHKILVSAQGPFVLGLGLKGLGPGFDNCEKKD